MRALRLCARNGFNVCAYSVHGCLSQDTEGIGTLNSGALTLKRFVSPWQTKGLDVKKIYIGTRIWNLDESWRKNYHEYRHRGGQ